MSDELASLQCRPSELEELEGESLEQEHGTSEGDGHTQVLGKYWTLKESQYGKARYTAARSRSRFDHCGRTRRVVITTCAASRRQGARRALVHFANDSRCSRLLIWVAFRAVSGSGLPWVYLCRRLLFAVPILPGLGPVYPPSSSTHFRSATGKHGLARCTHHPSSPRSRSSTTSRSLSHPRRSLPYRSLSSSRIWSESQPRAPFALSDSKQQHTPRCSGDPPLAKSWLTTTHGADRSRSWRSPSADTPQ